ncbi:DUF188 domain-containing protein [Desulfobacterales bacterium HSG17]|nr:DUF188 domain-containing protein [Desulfobacterales bacterium HSG17]
MKIWVDADACPVVIKDILYKAAQRTRLQLTLVANHPMHIPRLKWIKLLQVAPGFDVADDEIVKRLDIGDLVITSDIPLAAQVLEKGGYALSPRGELYSSDNIRGRMHMRESDIIHYFNYCAFNSRATLIVLLAAISHKITL